MGMKGAGKLCAPHRTKGRLDTHVKRARARRNREAPAPQAAVPPPPPALPVPVGAGAGNPFDVLQVQVAPGSPQEPIFVLVDAAQHIVACLQRKHHADSKLLNCLDAKLLLSSAVPPLAPAPPHAGGTGVTVGTSESAPTTRGGPGGGASGSRRGGFATEAASGGDDFEDSIMMEDSGGPRGGGSGSARPSPWVPEVPPGSSRLGTRLGAARGTVTASGKPGEGREERPAECLLGGGDTSIQVHDARLLHPPPPYTITGARSYSQRPLGVSQSGSPARVAEPTGRLRFGATGTDGCNRRPARARGCGGCAPGLGLCHRRRLR